MQALKTLHTVLLLAILLASVAPIAASASPAAGPVHVTLTATVGADGYAVIYHRLPYTSCRIVGVHGGLVAPNGRPVMLAFTPDPLLWRKLMETPLALTWTGVPVKVAEGCSGGVCVYGAVPGAPGQKVRVELECYGKTASRANAERMIIIVPDNPVVERYAREIAEIHEREGLRVEMVTLSQLAGIAPANPPRDVCKPGRGDAPKYNLTLALKLVAFLRSKLGEGVRYVLIIGGASEVPPVYVCSPILYELVNPREAVVPTDYYYADPNYDGYVELAVGRIPTTDPFSLQEYVDALKRWVEGGSWQHNMLVGGGAPFATTLMVGEAAAEEAYTLLHRLNASVGIVALSLGNYIGQSFSQYLGSYGLYYLVSHGAGNAMLDYVPGGLWNYDFEVKLTSGTAYARKPMVFLTPACRVGFWDYDLVEPPFIPPSIGVKLVESGSAVAFIGYSRIAVETITSIDASEGRVTLRLGGADAPLLMFLRQLRDAPTLGEAWRRALNAYLISPDSHYVAFLVSGEEEIGHLVSREAVFLGDPAAPNPWRASGGGGGWQPPTLSPPEGSLWVGATLIAMPLAKYAKGYIPAYNPAFNTTVAIHVNGTCPSSVSSYALYRVEGYVFIGYTKLNTTVEGGGGGCKIGISVPYDAPSLIRTVLLYPNGSTVYYMLVGGVAASNGTILLRGLDALETIGDEVLAVYVNGKPLTVVAGGATFYKLNASSVKGVVAVRPLHRYDVIYGGERVARDMARLLDLYRANITATRLGGGWPGRVEFTGSSTTAPAQTAATPASAGGEGATASAKVRGVGEGGGYGWGVLLASYAVAVAGFAAVVAVGLRRRG